MGEYALEEAMEGTVAIMEVIVVRDLLMPMLPLSLMPIDFEVTDTEDTEYTEDVGIMVVAITSKEMLNLSLDIEDTEDTEDMVDIVDTAEDMVDIIEVDYQSVWKHDQELGGILM